ncbi:hypothetical protein [Caulobacter sp. DWR1-3-2b1]|uniref:hypothetical protein n=1 Tax=Caulobacter sp. DWR1-3-2b1 TaxID=2804670 RepID=UPI003CEE3B5A
MKRSLFTGAAIVALAVGLSACGGGGNNDVAVTQPPSAKFEDQFGASFGMAFRADPNTEARDIASGDIIAPNLTAEPVTLQGS